MKINLHTQNSSFLVAKPDSLRPEVQLWETEADRSATENPMTIGFTHLLSLATIKQDRLSGSYGLRDARGKFDDGGNGVVAAALAARIGNGS